MEEAEALCTRMGIMVNGELKCLGRYFKYNLIYILVSNILNPNSEKD
jgi:hypothetical protein